MSDNGVYISDSFSEPMTGAHNFANNFDLNDPATSMTDYARIMREHTKKQLSSATQSARRRSSTESDSRTASLKTVSSTDS